MIYFIYDKVNNAVKIGVTVNIYSRLANLQCGNPTKLTVIKTIDGTYKEEEILHYHYRKYRLVGEWFIYSADIESDINHNAFTTIYDRYKHDRKTIKDYITKLNPFKSGKTVYKHNEKIETNTKYKLQKDYQERLAETKYQKGVAEIDNHFVKKDNAKIMVKELKSYLLANNIKSKYGEKNMPINKLLEHFQVTMKQITWQGKRERFVIGLDYKQNEV